LSRLPKGLERALLVVALIHAVALAGIVISQLAASRGLVMADGISPIGGDFVNLFTVGRMLLAGEAGAIYDPVAYDAFQQTLIGTPIGLRLWAYPPHSLVLALPFGVLDYFTGLAAWSVLGLGVLAFGARRFGFSWAETVLLVTSPGALLCVYWGQTGNLAAGLALVALGQRGVRDGLAVAATTLLTIKPQMGYLLPLHWATGRNWGIFVAVSVAVIGVLVATLLIGGIGLWQGYLFETLPQLSLLERHGRGPFMTMIPSVFMSLRLLGVDGDLALNIHLVFAALLLPVVVWLLWTRREPGLRAATTLVGMAVLTPYLHVYDLVPVLVTGMLVMGAYGAATGWGRGVAAYMLLLAWSMPYLTLALGLLRVPLTPLLMLALLVLIARAPKR
jgi:alpha-1,2-mannosyltransferase